MDHVDWCLWLVKELISLTVLYGIVLCHLSSVWETRSWIDQRSNSKEQKTGKQNKRGFGLVVFYDVLCSSYGAG